MKLAILFIFAILSPFTIFVAELMYGGTTPQELKKGLAQSDVYANISDFLISVQPEGKQDDQTAFLSKQIYDRFTPAYVQEKTDKLIDDGYIWITKDGPSPVLSFTDIKADMLTSNPEFEEQFAQIRYLANQNQGNGEQALEQSSGDPTAQGNTDALTTLAQNDFTVPVGEYFLGLKTFYGIMKIVTPILIALLIGLLLVQLRINNSAKARLTWIGSSFITASAFGYGMIFFNQIAVKELLKSTLISSENFLATFAPIMLQLMNLFMQEYAKIQIYVSIGMLLIGVIFVAIAKLKKY